MSDEFAKKVLGEEAVKSAKDSGSKQPGGGFGKKSGKKKAIIAGVSVACVAVTVLCVILFWPKGNKSKAGGNYLEGLDVLCGPCGIAPVADGGFLITDTYGKKIWKATGKHAVVYAGAESVQDQYGEPMGGYNDASLMESLFKEPWAIVPFLDGYAVSDTENHAVRLVNKAGVQTVNGRSGELEQGDLGVTFDLPTGLAVDDQGNLYVADTGRSVIYRISKDGSTEVFTKELHAPMGICWYQGALYVAETGEHRVVSVMDGNVKVIAGTGEEGDADGPALTATFSSPMGVAVGPDGTVFVSDTVNATVRRVKDGVVDTIFAPDEERLTTSPVSPTGMLAYDGFLYVCDPFARRVYILPLQ